MTTLTNAIRVLETKATEDPALAEALRYLAVGSDSPVDPFVDPGSGVMAAARTVNERRERKQALQQMRHDGSLERIYRHWLPAADERTLVDLLRLE